MPWVWRRLVSKLALDVAGPAGGWFEAGGAERGLLGADGVELMLGRSVDA